MSDEAGKPPSSFPPHPQHPNLGSSGGEAQSAESLPSPQQLQGAPQRQAQTSVMQNTTATTSVTPQAAPLQSSKPPPPHIPSIPSPNQPATTTQHAPSDPRFPTMDSTNNPDIIMGGAAEQQQQPPQPQQQQQQHAPTIPPASTGPTPKVRAGGAPARIYLNETIVPHLLEGMKTITKDQPPNPLRALGEYLIQKSNEVEGGGASQAGGGVDIKTESK